MYTQYRFRTHAHRYFIDSRNMDEVCLCGKVKGERGLHKYRAKSCYYKGINYDSTLEANYAADLDRRIMGHDIVGWERQVPVRVDHPKTGEKIFTTRVDFLVHHTDGSKELVEVKGMETEVYKLKKKLIEMLWLPEHPEFVYTVVK